MVWPRQKDTRKENAKINYGLGATEEKEKRTSKKNVDGRSTSSHDNKKFRTRSMEKQRGMTFGFRQTVKVVKKPNRYIDKINYALCSYTNTQTSYHIHFQSSNFTPFTTAFSNFHYACILLRKWTSYLSANLVFKQHVLCVHIQPFVQCAIRCNTSSEPATYVMAFLSFII